MRENEISNISNFIKDSVAWLILEDQGCCGHPLNETLQVTIGWMPGYAVDDDLGIHSKQDPTYCINIGITQRLNEADMEYYNMPYREDGEVWETCFTLKPDYDADQEAENIFNLFEDLDRYEIAEDGEVLGTRDFRDLDYEVDVLIDRIKMSDMDNKEIDSLIEKFKTIKRD